MSQRLRKLLCRTRLWHSWHMVTSPGGERYRECAICGKDAPTGHIGGP